MNKRFDELALYDTPRIRRASPGMKSKRFLLRSMLVVLKATKSISGTLRIFLKVQKQSIRHWKSSNLTRY